jgi:hypothetical protein
LTTPPAPAALRTFTKKTMTDQFVARLLPNANQSWLTLDQP